MTLEMQDFVSLIWARYSSALRHWGPALVPRLERLHRQYESRLCYFVFDNGEGLRIVNVLGVDVRKNINGQPHKLVEVNRGYSNGNTENRKLTVSVLSRVVPSIGDLMLTEHVLYQQLTVMPSQFFQFDKTRLKIFKKDSVSFPGIQTLYYMRIVPVFLHEGVDITPIKSDPHSTYEWVEIK